MIIRRADHYDIKEIVREGSIFLKWVYPEKSLDTDYLYLTVTNLVERGVVLVAECEGEFCGVIAGMLQPGLWYPSETDLIELFWWVPEGARGTSSGMRLFREFIKKGKELEVTNIIMSKENISPLSEDVYTKRGFSLKETSYVMEV